MAVGCLHESTTSMMYCEPCAAKLEAKAALVDELLAACRNDEVSADLTKAEYARLLRVQMLAGDLARSIIAGEILHGLPDDIWRPLLALARELLYVN